MRLHTIHQHEKGRQHRQRHAGEHSCQQDYEKKHAVHRFEQRSLRAVEALPLQDGAADAVGDGFESALLRLLRMKQSNDACPEDRE